MDRVAPGSIIALRLPAVVATGAAVVVAALIARELGGDRRAQALTAGAQATALWITLAGHWLTPYTVEPVQWLVLVWLLVRWIRVRDDRLLPVLGLVVGVAADRKARPGTGERDYRRGRRVMRRRGRVDWATAGDPPGR